MKKNRLMIFSACFIIIFSSLSFAQVPTVQIKSGSIFISPQTSGSIILNTDIFTSSRENLFFSSPTPWENVCRYNECSSARTFNFSGFGHFEHLYRRGDFTIGGKTYKGVFHSGNLTYSSVPPYSTFRIPRIVRKKGKMFFSENINLSGILAVCEVSDMSGCPEGKELFRGFIYGHANLRITMKILNQSISHPSCNPHCPPVAYLKPVSYEYIFQEENPADIKE